MYKKVLIMGMTILSSLNFCFGANIQCWEENITKWDSRVDNNYASKSNNFSASDSKLYNTLKDKATVVFVGISSYDKVTAGEGVTAMPMSYIYKYFDYYKYVENPYIALKFCAVFNDSGSSTSASTNATAAVNYIIKAK